MSSAAAASPKKITSLPGKASGLAALVAKIDHIAIAVHKMDDSLKFFCESLGFSMGSRSVISGKKSAMDAAFLSSDKMSIVLMTPENDGGQVQDFLNEYGPGVHHIAVEVTDFDLAMDRLREAGLKLRAVTQKDDVFQAFTERDSESGLMFEIVGRPKNPERTIYEESAASLFEQLEESGEF